MGHGVAGEFITARVIMRGKTTATGGAAAIAQSEYGVSRPVAPLADGFAPCDIILDACE